MAKHTSPSKKVKYFYKLKHYYNYIQKQQLRTPIRKIY